ncbi:MAG TPA: hypothetical protein VKA32_05180, partial [Gammaproteobacteria bacterium]|nr:hypothetical protein [Gammaproteobacteria bacterium]
TFDASGNLWVPDYGAGTVTEYQAASLSGTPTTGTAISASGPVTVVFAASGNLWLADYTAGTVTEYQAASLSGTPTTGTQITGLSQPYGVAFDPPPYDLPLSH